jgi:ankyrin repeat protein
MNKLFSAIILNIILISGVCGQNERGVIRTTAESTDTSYFVQDDDVYNLCMASLRGEIKNVQLLLKRKVDINAQYENGLTALIYGAQSGQIDICKLLIENGAKINSKSFDGRTPLIHAVKAGQTEISKLLIEKGADINIKDSYGRSSLIYASFAGDSATCQFLLLNKADISIKDADGVDALMSATRNHRPITAKLLLFAGANVNTADWQGITPLMIAAGTSDETILKLLLAFKANPNLITNKRETALTIAIQKNNARIVSQLIQNEANVNERLTISEKPLTIAHYYKTDNAIIDTLKHYDAKQNILPDFRNVTFGPEFNFNLTDYMQGICIGVKDNKYKLDIQTGFHFRVKYKTIIDYRFGANQLHELRNLWYVSINKNFELFFPQIDRKFGINLGLKESYTFGSYKGIITKPINGYILSPEAGIYTIGNLVQFGISYNYFKIDTYDVSPHRIIISAKIVFGAKNKLDFSIYKPWE